MLDPIRRTEQEILEKINLAKKAAQERQKQERRKQQEQQREAKINQYMQEISRRLRHLQEQLQQSLAECAILGEEDPIYQDLRQQLQLVQSQLQNPRPLAEAQYQIQLAQEEVALNKREWEDLIIAEERRMDEALAQWRQGLIQDLSETIDAAKTYFEASDIAVYFRDYREDLLATEQLEPLLRRLIHRINELNTRGNPFELRYPVETTLNRMVDFALQQRSQRSTLLGGSRAAPLSTLRQEHRHSPDRPYEYRGITGKVVVYGSHPRLQRNVVRRLPQVTSVWFDFDLPPEALQDRVTTVGDADIAILLTTYSSQEMQQAAQEACQRFGVPLLHQHATGIRSLIELIVVELQKHHLLAKVV